MTIKIIGIENMDSDELIHELNRGGKFVLFEYCISIFIMTFKRSSSIYFIRGNQNALGKGVGFTCLSLIAGWWGIPWGPIYTIGALITNLRGGRDVTHDVVMALNDRAE